MQDVRVSKKERLSIWDISLGVFCGLIMFTLASGAIILLLRATGDLPR